MSSLLSTWARHPAYRRGRVAVVTDLGEPWAPEAATMAWRGLLHGGMFASLVEQMAALAPERLSFLLDQPLFAHPADACAGVKRCQSYPSGAGSAVAVAHVRALLAAASTHGYKPGHPVWAAVLTRDEELVGDFFKAAPTEMKNAWFKAPIPPLHHAVRLNWLGGVQLAIAAGASLTDEDSQGNPALHLATRQSRLALIPELVALGADPNARNTAGRSPLGAAVRANTVALNNTPDDPVPGTSIPGGFSHARRLATVEALLRVGADLYLRDGRRQRCATPLQTMHTQLGAEFAARAQESLLRLRLAEAPAEGAQVGRRTRL